jgi:hypothetical protein
MGKFIDLTGYRFGKWTVIRQAPNKNRYTCWLCKCGCGSEKNVMTKNLRHSTSTNCGCEKRVDLTGKIFGRWLVIEKLPYDGRHTHWLCRCVCGNEKVVDGESLKREESKSCGCYHKETRSLEYGLAAKRKAYRTYLVSAKRRSIIFELSFDQFLDLTQQKCYYCGIESSNYSKPLNGNGGFAYNGIDRVDNTRGYTIGNSKSCCKICNNAKANLTTEEFCNWNKRVYEKNNLVAK